MQTNLNQITEHLEIIVSLGVTTISFITYWFISESKKMKSFFINDKTAEKNEVSRVVFQKIAGVLFLGIIPAIVCLLVFPYKLDFYGINFMNFSKTLLYTAIISCIIIPLTIFSTRKKNTREIYPQMRITNWNTKLVMLNSLNWAVYLFAYEFLFRGVLFLLIVPSIGIWPAIAINTAIYSCTHIPKGVKEALSAIPFGIVLCIFTLETSNIWVAFLAHLVLALTNDYGALFFSPSMRFEFRKK